MKLSVVILFCDKDVKYLYGFLKQLESHIFTEYEIILIDNREKDKTQISTKYKLIKPKENIFLFEGRRIGFENSSGEYIWNVDVDDEIIGNIYTSDFKSNADVIQFYYDVNGMQLKPGDHKPVRMFGNNVWSRFYKSSKLKEAYKPIKRRDLKIHTFEDQILLNLILQTNPTISYVDKLIYKYKISNANISKKFFTKKDFEIFTKGYKDLPYLFNFCENKERLMELRKKRYEWIKQRLVDN